MRATSNQLGANPLQALEQQTGKWTLILLIVTLSITPLRRSLSYLSMLLHSRYGKRLSDWNWVIRLRRMLGLHVFFYATLHIVVFLNFDISWDWALLSQEAREKPYLLAGSLCFLLLIPLAITTPVAAMRRLGKYWRRIHRSIYVVAMLAVLHFLWVAKSGDNRPWTYIGIVAFLLCYRLLAHFGWFIRKPMDDGMEVPDRSKR
jgi:sulfoxide reductase heme-binding subunit YedZ